MVTMVGSQASFSDAVKELIELDFDAIEAYNCAIKAMKNSAFKEKLEAFKADHERHVHAFSNLLKKHKIAAPAGPSSKQWLTKGKVVMAELVGEVVILKAMNSNETDTNLAYETMCKREDVWEDAKDLLFVGRKDELRHKQWLEHILKQH